MTTENLGFTVSSLTADQRPIMLFCIKSHQTTRGGLEGKLLPKGVGVGRWSNVILSEAPWHGWIFSSYNDINDGWEAGEEKNRPTMSKWDTLSPLCTNEDFKQGPCFRVNPRLYRSQTLYPFQHSLQWGDYKHIRHGTKPEQAVYNSLR